MAKKNQSDRLTHQQKMGHGVIGIFGEEAKFHDLEVGKISHIVLKQLEVNYPRLTFRYRKSISKKEINAALQKIDPYLGQFVKLDSKTIMLQAASIYTQGDGERWSPKRMFDVMLDVANTSLQVIGSDLFQQLTKK